MPLTPQELKEKLLRTLDKDYNVVDMAGALELLSILEKYPVTKETLEQTRIGRFVNEMRKKTADKEFAKRIKNLVRKWQDLLKPTSESSAGVNGKAAISSRILEGQVSAHLKGLVGLRPASPSSRPETPCSVRSSVSSPRSVPGTTTVTSAAAVSRRDHAEIGSIRTHLSCASTESVITRSAAVSPSLGNAVSVSPSLRGSASSRLHSAPSTPVSSSANLGYVLVGAASHYVDVINYSSTTTTSTSGKRKLSDETEEDYQGIKIKIKKRNATESEVRLNDVGADNWSCSSNGNTKKTNVNGLLQTSSHQQQPLPSHTSPSPTLLQSAVEEQPPAPPPKPRRGRPPKSALARAASTVLVRSVVAPSPSVKYEPTTRSDFLSLPSSVPKVSTTAELIQKLHASGELRLVASETVKKIASNQIVKETFNADESVVVPVAAKPRARKKNSSLAVQPPSTPDVMTMSQIKNEMVHKFLESSVHAAAAAASPLLPSCDLGMMNLLKRLDPPPDPELLFPVDRPSARDKSKRPRPPHLDGQTVKTDFDDDKDERDALSEADPWKLMPPVDPKAIDWTSLDYVAPDPDSRPPVTDEDVERLHSNRWPGVNGQFDSRNEWQDWAQTYSQQTHDDAELLHILPYVNLN